MYIVKNAYLSIIRGKGRNILIGIIIMAITISACVALTINKSGKALIEKYRDSNPIEVSFTLNPMSLREADDETKSSFEALTVDMINTYGDSEYVSDYYYTEETSLSSSNITAVDYSSIDIPELDNNAPERPDSGKGGGMNIGDFRLTGYSDPSYINDFINGTKKITSGEMFTKDSTDNVVIISEELASQNSLEVGSVITLYSPSDESVTFDYTVIGIFEDNSDVETNGFMQMNAMNSRNQMYTNITSIHNVISNIGDTSESSGKRMMSSNGLSAKYYLNNNDDLDEFESEVREKGLSEYYQVNTNEEEALASLKPIQNLSSFSMSFLIIILVVGGVILGIINMINIRERKYEIGVLRAIGMNKKKVTLQLITEIFMVSMAALILGTGIGVILSQPVTNSMLKNEIESYEEEKNNISENFGGEGFERPGFNRGNDMLGGNNNANVNYVDTLDVSVDVLTILQLFLVSLGLTVVSGLVSVAFVNKYEPNKILQNRA